MQTHPEEDWKEPVPILSKHFGAWGKDEDPAPWYAHNTPRAAPPAHPLSEVYGIFVGILVSTIFWVLVACALWLLYGCTPAQAQVTSWRQFALETDTALPEPVRLYEIQKDRLPAMEVDGQQHGGLSLCKLLADRDKPQPFFATPKHLLRQRIDHPMFTGPLVQISPETCDLSRVIAAYGLWCAAGVEDASPQGPHFSQCMGPSIEIRQYGQWTVIYCNHYLKSKETHTLEGQLAATEFLLDLPITLDIRGAGVALFSRDPEWAKNLPPI